MGLAGVAEPFWSSQNPGPGDLNRWGPKTHPSLPLRSMHGPAGQSPTTLRTGWALVGPGNSVARQWAPVVGRAPAQLAAAFSRGSSCAVAIVAQTLGRRLKPESKSAESPSTTDKDGVRFLDAVSSSKGGWVLSV